jgi:hypothetical protein
MDILLKTTIKPSPQGLKPNLFESQTARLEAVPLQNKEFFRKLLGRAEKAHKYWDLAPTAST